ncbi:hypothetical protein F4808DRAFT_472474 [Astrocystis sublimbata]|nr:hypothetical protein F4808DRAFT_472474 [Astrocystis sublimbata]
MAVPATHTAARNLVQRITKNHGFVSPERLEELGTFDQGLRRDIEEALLTKDKLIGSSVLTLATNLYTSKARFVFELLQNADDNMYSRAKASGVAPYVSFHVYPKRIVVECNEDGFTDRNLEAICAIGKSSKTGAQGYIGEKGIGFKSVFMAASKVHIQSGMLSFSFRHRIGDSGMGMISPLWEETDDSEKLPSTLTRITLHLHDDGDPEMLAKSQRSIQAQFEDLQEAMLLFMKNLQKIDVTLYNETLQQTSSTIYSVERHNETSAVLKKTRTTNGLTDETVKRYHVTTHKVTNLARNDNRTYSAEEERTRAYATSQVVLAFPLTESSIPVVEPQALFVFLPVRQVGFNFLIHADFTTNANRQDIVQDSPRNSGLIGAVADGVIKAFLQFCKHDTLRFQWMRYLPKKDDSNLGGLWLTLVHRIEQRLAETPILYNRLDSTKSHIEELCRLTPDMRDANGDPLFATIDSLSRIVSRHYNNDDLLTLTEYGLKKCTYSHFLEWVTEDLEQDVFSSRMKSPKTTDDWHYRVAKKLYKLLNQLHPSRVGKVLFLELVPVNDGSWVSILEGVYFQKVDGLEIPPNIDLRLVAKDVVNPHRLALFKQLGVMTASISLVRDSILRFYDKSKPDIETSLKHLKFLYSTETEDKANYGDVKLLDQNGNIADLATDYLYIVNDKAHGAWELFRPRPDLDAPGFSARFAHPQYFEDPPTETRDENWESWFYNKLGVNDIIPLGYGDHGEKALNYIQTYRPEKLLGAFHELYRSDPIAAKKSSFTRDTIVLCQGNQKLPLINTFFPTSDLVDKTKKFLGEVNSFPWLQLEFENDSNRIPPTWKSMLQLLDVPVHHTDVEFAFHMFDSLRKASIDESFALETSQLCELYDHIQERCWESKNPEDEQEKIMQYFWGEPRIYVPGPHSTWAFDDDCVWDAPQELVTKYVLKKIYGSCHCRRGDKCPYFTDFFVETLGVPASCTWEDYVEELEELKKECGGFDTIMGIYKAIDSLPMDQRDIDAISPYREAFDDEPLIHASVNNRMSWYRPEQCVWSKSAQLRGKVSLSEEYEDLENLFTKVLGVNQVDLQMAIDDLKLTASQQISVPELKESIWTVNSLLPTTSSPPSPSEILQNSIFPVRFTLLGTVTVNRQTEKSEFFIVDREQLEQKFANKVRLLDFTLKEVSQLRPLIHWLGLQNRYLSQCTKEVTSFPGKAASVISIPTYTQDLHRLYEALKNATIFETDTISSNLQLSQDGKLHEVESSRTTLHIDGDATSLKVYIPRDKDDQQFIFSTKLARRLFEWMMTDPTTQICDDIEQEGVNATRDILLVPYAKLSEALEERGIAGIDIENTDEVLLEPSLPFDSVDAAAELIRNLDLHDEDDAEPDADDVEPDEDDAEPDEDDAEPYADDTELLEDNVRPIHSSENFQFTFRFPTALYNVSSYRAGSLSFNENAFARIQTPSAEPAVPSRDENADRLYMATLSRVIAAGRRDFIPSHGNSEGERTSGSSHDAANLSWRSPSQVERNCKVGAAGELYVFELLLHLSRIRGLPSFDRNNWKSTIRKYVTIHPEYADMEDWRGHETSDITYLDTQGVLTDELIEKGYLARERWEGRRPDYFIEVKSTTSSCETPFYMSKAQYKRMQNNSGQRNDAPDTIYVIFRVFWLGHENMGLRVYLDPEALRRTNQLEFQSESWSVIPGRAS